VWWNKFYPPLAADKNQVKEQGASEDRKLFAGSLPPSFDLRVLPFVQFAQDQEDNFVSQSPVYFMFFRFSC